MHAESSCSLCLQSPETCADLACSLFCSRVSNIEQRLHCESRIFCFLPVDRNRWEWSFLLHGFTKVRKRELESRIFVSSVRFLLTLLNDFRKMEFYDRFATETWASNTCWINCCSSGERTNANTGKLQGCSDSAFSCFFLFRRHGICSRPD